MQNILYLRVRFIISREANYIENQLQALTTRVDMFEEMLREQHIFFFFKLKSVFFKFLYTNQLHAF